MCRYNSFQQQKSAPKLKGALGHESAEEVAEHFSQIAQKMPSINRFDATVNKSLAQPKCVGGLVFVWADNNPFAPAGFAVYDLFRNTCSLNAL